MLHHVPNEEYYDFNVVLFFSVQEYFRLRSQAVAQLKQTDEHPYPHKFHVSISLAEFIDTYNHVSDGEILDGTQVSIAGSDCLLF
jgi:lysyl-tRNA synthetase class 2